MSPEAEERRRARVALVVALAAPLVGAALAAPVWIPSWAEPVEWFAGVLALGGAIAAMAWAAAGVQRAWRAGRGRVVSVGLALVVVVVALGVGFFGQWKVFPPRFERSFEAADGTTVYVYDTSFLDPSVEVRTGRGVWPVTRWLSGSGLCQARDVELDADGHTLHVCHRDCDVRTRKCADSY